MSAGRPPIVPLEAALHIIQDRFPFDEVLQSSFKELPSYDDRHYQFQGHVISPSQTRCGERHRGRYVLRVSNLMFSPELVEGSNAVMLHLWSRGINCTRPVASRRGLYTEMVQGKNIAPGVGGPEQEYPVRVLEFVSGILMSELDAKFLTPSFLYRVGSFAGRVSAALEGFSHPAIEEFVNECWDLQHFSSIKKYIPLLSDGKKRSVALSVLKLYQQNLQPAMAGMKKGVIHGDLNVRNIIVRQSGNEAQIVGLIDFGDCVHSYYLFELAILVSYSMMNRRDPIQFVAPMIRGYLDVFPLSQEELQCLYYAVLALLCVAAVRGECNAAKEPGNTHMHYFSLPAWDLLFQLLDMPKESIDHSWSSYHLNWTG